MKRVIQFTLILGILVLLVTIYIALQKPVRMIEYSDGIIKEVNSDNLPGILDNNDTTKRH